MGGGRSVLQEKSRKDDPYVVHSREIMCRPHRNFVGWEAQIRGLRHYVVQDFSCDIVPDRIPGENTSMISCIAEDYL